MEEEKILIINEENSYDTVVVENTDEIIYDETIQIIELDEPEIYTVGTDEAFVSLGGQNEQLNHALLHNRDIPDQHTIGSITGLREELDDIEALKTVESDKRGYANYHEWQTPYIGSVAERVGYFVSIHTKDHKISICDAETEIFGVTVDVAGFVGGQDEVDKSLDATYALVANTGVVKVRCVPSVWAGSYVMSNNRGEAVNSGKYGYYVISIINDEIDGQKYAVISLDSTMNQVYQLSEHIAGFEEDLVNVERKTNSAINAATEALKRAESSMNSALQNSQDALNNANSALDKVTEFEDGFTDEITGIKVQVDAINDEMVTAIQDKTQEIVGEMIEDAVSTNKEIESIQKQLSDTRTDLDASLDEVRRLSDDEAMLSKYLSNDYKTIDTWATDLRKDISQIYYVKDEGLYYYYDVETDTWLKTPEPSEAGLSEVIASIRQKADKDEAMVENLTAYSGEKYETIEVWDRYAIIFGWENKKYIADPYIIYYDEETQLYWQCDVNNTDTPWSSSSVAPSDYKALDEKDIDKVYYAEDTKRYYYYDNGWHSSNSSVASLVQSIALTRQIADENKAEIATILGYSGEDGFSLASIKASVEENKSEIDALTSYVEKSYIELKQPWNEVNDADKKPENVYYAKDSDGTWKYWYYTEGNTPSWVGSIDPADAGLVASIANINQKATDNEAKIGLLTDFQDDIGKRVAKLEVESDGIETMVVNVNKYSLGKYSQAYGLSLGEAAELLVDGTVFVPYENTDPPEVYDRIIELDEEFTNSEWWDKADDKYKWAIYYYMNPDAGMVYNEFEGNMWFFSVDKPINSTYSQDFTKGYYYTWNKTEGKWVVSNYGGVDFPTDYIRGDEDTKFIVIENVYKGSYQTITRKTDGGVNDTLYYVTNDGCFYYYHDGWILAQNPDFEVGALYYWNEDGDVPYWQKVATLNDNTLSRAMSQVRQKANSIEASVTNVRGDLAAIDVRVDEAEAKVESVTEFDGRLTTIEQKSNKDEARINMLVAHGLEETDIPPNEMNKPDTDMVYYYKNEGEELYWYHNGTSWTSTEDIEDSNVAKRIRSAGIITAINDDTSEVKISGDKIGIEAMQIDINGKVTFTDPSSDDGKTQISGSVVRTGVIKSTNSRSREVESTYSVISGDADYSFQYNSATGYYESNNKGVGNSIAMCKVMFSVNEKADVKFDACSYAEYNDSGQYAYDYGMFGYLDGDFSTESTYESDDVYMHFRFNNSSSDSTITYYDVEPNKEHHVWIAFRKDPYTDKYDDCLRFKFVGAVISEGTTIDLNNGSITTKNFKVDSGGNVIASNMTLTGGTIQSSNYIQDNTGMKIDLSTGAIDTPNFKVDAGGKVTISGSSSSGGSSSGDNEDYLTADDLGVNGSTEIDGGRIKTGYISADRIKAGSITTEKMSIGVGTKLNQFYNAEFYEGDRGWYSYNGSLEKQGLNQSWAYMQLEPSNANESIIMQKVWLVNGQRYAIAAQVCPLGWENSRSDVSIHYFINTGYSSTGLDLNGVYNPNNLETVVKMVFDYSGNTGFVDLGISFRGILTSSYTPCVINIAWMSFSDATGETPGFYCTRKEWLASGYKDSNYLGGSVNNNTTADAYLTQKALTIDASGNLVTLGTIKSDNGEIGSMVYNRGRMDITTHSYYKYATLPSFITSRTSFVNPPEYAEFEGAVGLNSAEESAMYGSKIEVASEGEILGSFGKEYTMITSGGVSVVSYDIEGKVKHSALTPYGIEVDGVLVTSRELSKRDISQKNSILNAFKSSKIYEYKMKYDDDKARVKTGFVIERETPEEVLSDDGKHINLYSMASMNWKATQELLERLEAIEERMRLNERTT